MRNIKVKVSNDIERDAVLVAWKLNGCCWTEGEGLFDYKPIAKYPYYLYRKENGKVAYDENDVSDIFKKVPISKFKKFMSVSPVIKIYSDGKAVVKAVDKHGNVGEARCNPLDVFSLEVGAKLAIERLNTIKVGDAVVVTDCGHSYTTFSDFFEIYKIPIGIAARYMYTKSLKNGHRLKVIRIEDHPWVDDRIAVCQDNLMEVYLIGLDGLKKI